MTTIGVVGYGIVGRAVANGFKTRSGYEVLMNDVLPSRSQHSKKELMEKCSHIFLCVPTPIHKDWNMDLWPLGIAIDDLRQASEKRNQIIVVKSTLISKATRILAGRYSDVRFAYNPEFLRENHAEEDFLYPDRIIIGALDKEVSESIGRLYADWRCPIYHVSPEQAEMAKLLSNAYLVLKVAFGLEGERLCKELGVEDAKIVMRLVGMDRRIGASHLDPSLGKIPNNSPCLPKDLRALLSQADSPLLRKAYEEAVQ